MDYFKEFNVQMNKLNDLLAENNLIGNFKANSYPMTLTISQDQSLDAQMELYAVEENGVSSKDAKLVLTFPVAEIGVRIYGRFIITDSLMTKIKGHGKKLRDLYLQCEYSMRMSHRDPEPDAEPTIDLAEDITDDFGEFFDEDNIED